MRGPLLLALLGLVAGCASTSPTTAVHDTSELVKARSGAEVTWLGDATDQDRADVKRYVHKLLADDLTLTSAIRVSLLENRNLQALYEELGIGQADLVQAGLLKNPTLEGTYDFPLDHEPAYQVGIVTDVLQLVTLGSRKTIARTALEGTKYRVASEVLRHVHDVKVAYFAVQAAQQTLDMRKAVADAAQASVELARRQHDAGTTSDLDLANQETLFVQVATDLARSRADLASARERLNRAMGVWGPDTTWKIASKLPELPATEPPLDHLESKAVASRYDLAAAHKDVEVVSYALALAKNTRWTGAVDAGVDYHREAEGVRLLGPSVSVELPLFDQRQAVIARIEAQLRLAQNREAALAVDIRSEVRELAARLDAARSVVESYQKTLVPMRERIVTLSQEQYDAMLLGVFQLLVAKQNEISTYREFIDALRDYWSIRAELEWALGGALAPAKGTGAHAAPAAPATKGQGEHEHHAP